MILVPKRKFKHDVESEEYVTLLQPQWDKALLMWIQWLNHIERRDWPVRVFRLPSRMVHKHGLGRQDPRWAQDVTDFEDWWIQQGTNFRETSIANDKKELPVLRKLNNKKISANQIMSAGSVSSCLKQLGERGGYEDTIKCYIFRRGFANSLEGKPTC